MIRVIPEPDYVTFAEMERCCFCRDKTTYWTDIKTRTPGEQVACCEQCAEYAEEVDVPTKSTWFRREQISDARFGPIWSRNEF